MDLEDAGAKAKFMISDRDSKYTRAFDAVLKVAGLRVVTTGIQMPRMNSIMERWVQTCQRDLLDRTLVWNQRHLLHVLREFERHDIEHRPHQALGQAAPLHALPGPVTDPDRITRLDVHRRNRLGGTLHEYRHAA
ncbi:integrase core domain-containing protein [Streptomyces sp. NPDC002577]